MSRSLLSLAFSARSLVSALCSGITGLSPAPLSWPLLAKRTQFSSVCFGVPSILAVTAAARLPLPNLTASNLNCSVAVIVVSIRSFLSLLKLIFNHQLWSTFFKAGTNC